MHRTVTLQRQGTVGVVIIDNPPVNALSREVREHLLARLQEGCADLAIQAIVIGCAGNTFVAGADLKEFDLPLQAPHLPDVLAAIEQAAKPIVAALHGSVFGGGLELALACHYRVAAPDTQFALPEVSLGLVPGAGGTQRLPRLCGVALALDMILGNERIGAAQALRNGLLDELSDTSLLACAADFARKIIDKPISRACDRSVPDFDQQAFDQRAQTIIRKAPGQEAPAAALHALRGAWELPFAEGMARERELFIARRHSEQARALRHVFFAERGLASRCRDLARQAPTRPVETVAVIGAGTMGSGIALCLANAGIVTRLIDTQPQALERGRSTIDRYFTGAVEKGRIEADAAARRAALITFDSTLEGVADADLVIEAVFEDLAVKQAVFRELDRFARPGAILATNTSYLDIEAIAGVTKRPGDVIGMHFFSPAHVMKLLEVVRTAAVQPDVLATVLQLGRRLGKTAVAVGNCYGFVGNRLLAVREREAGFLLEEGAAPEDIDRVIRQFGFPMGPFELRDLAGVDIAWRNRQARLAQLSAAERRCNWIEQLHEAGRLGQKTGAGFYRYEEGQRRGLPDPYVARILVAHRQTRGIEPRAITDQEILDRCLFAMVNEAACLLEQGVVDSPDDIDLVWIHGYGFPRYRGGVLFHADQVGLSRVVGSIDAWAAMFPERGMQVTGLLRTMASQGTPFIRP
jgi:3-hydroxyacyl-CoA dehydrogenase